MYDNYFDRLNQETRDYNNNRPINRFNPSTKSNYTYFDPNALNNRTYYANNGQYANHYNYR